MKIIFKNLSRNQIIQAYNICKEKLGNEFLSLGHFEKLMKENKMIVATMNDEVVGFLSFDVMSEDDFFTSKNINKKGRDEQVFVIKTCAVAHEKCKIGTELFLFIIEKFAQNINTFYCCAWKHKGGVNIEALCFKFGFKKELVIENYWYNDSLGKEDYCPVCKSPCFCSMVLYKKSQ